MRHGLSGFELNVTFNDGTTAYFLSSLGVTSFHDAVPTPKQGSEPKEIVRIKVPNQQLIDDVQSFGIMTAAAYTNPCTHQLALQQLGGDGIKQMTFKWVHVSPPPTN